MRTSWLYWAVAVVIVVSTTEAVKPRHDTEDDSTESEATTLSNLLPKDASATWNQDEEKDGSLEGELRLLEQADPTDPYDPLEELDDTDQQRDRPTDEEDDNGSDVTVTTLVPTATTEEDTRVDEPTDRGPAEPTKENGVTVTMVIEQSAPSATLSPDIWSLGDASQQSNRTEDSTKKSAAASDKNNNSSEEDDEEDESEEQEEKEEEELEAIKRQMKEEDDLIPVTIKEQAKQDDEVANELDELDDNDVDNEDVKSDEKQENGMEEGSSAAEAKLAAISRIGQRPQSTEEKELLSRSTRRAQEIPAAGQFPAKVNEDVLELMVRLQEKPRSWARISNLLGKLDYESAAQLKSALQIQALKDNQATEEANKHNNNMKHVITAAKLASLPPSNQAHMNSVSAKNHHLNHHRPSAYNDHHPDHHPNATPKIPGKHSKLFNGNNKLGLKQLTTSNGRHGGGQMHHQPPPNTIHVQWEKNRRPPIPKHTAPVHTNTRLQYLAQKVAGAQNSSPWYDPNRSGFHMGPVKGDSPMMSNAGVKPLVSPHQTPGAVKDIASKARPLRYPYNGPISTLAVDVPGQGMLNKNTYPGGEKNNQAFIAVSVYKPKDTYRQVDLSPKMNRLPYRYPSTLRTKGSGNSNFAMEQPVTVVGSPAIDVVPSHSGRQGFKNHKGKGRNKGAKAKQKERNGMKLGGKGKAHHARKLKYNNKLATDEIEAQLLALSKMERKLKQHLMQKEKLRQRIRMKHDQHHHNVRLARQVASFM